MSTPFSFSASLSFSASFSSTTAFFLILLLSPSAALRAQEAPPPLELGPLAPRNLSARAFSPKPPSPKPFSPKPAPFAPATSSFSAPALLQRAALAKLRDPPGANGDDGGDDAGSDDKGGDHQGGDGQRRTAEAESLRENESQSRTAEATGRVEVDGTAGKRGEKAAGTAEGGGTAGKKWEETLEGENENKSWPIWHDFFKAKLEDLLKCVDRNKERPKELGPRKVDWMRSIVNFLRTGPPPWEGLSREKEAERWEAHSEFLKLLEGKSKRRHFSSSLTCSWKLGRKEPSSLLKELNNLKLCNANKKKISNSALCKFSEVVSYFRKVVLEEWKQKYQNMRN